MTHPRMLFRIFGIVILTHAVAASDGAGTLFEVEVANRAFYINDIADYSRLATAQGPVPLPQQFARTFAMVTALGDIVSLNGRPARGAWVSRYQVLNLSRTPQPSQAIAETERLGVGEDIFEFQTPDGTAIGTIMARGLLLGQPPPGSPQSATATNYAIAGGTGFYAGASGQMSQIRQTFGRATSTLEDPGLRQALPGGTATFVLKVSLDSEPTIVADGGRPAVFHADFVPVDSSRPARPGETLTLAVSGLGPTNPVLTPGSVFDMAPVRVVHVPVTVLANGAEVPPVNQLGWPSYHDRYRVDFVVPGGQGATLTIQLAVAGFRSSAVTVAFQP